MRMGVNIHEAMHQVFTNFNATEDKLKAIDNQQKRDLFMTIANLIEDPAIENFADQVVGGPALDAMYYTIDRCYDMAAPISDHDGMPPEQVPLYEYTTALIHFGDGGLVKGEFTSLAARRCFNKTAGLVYQAINEPNNKKRIDIAAEVYKIALATLPSVSDWNMRESMSAVTQKTGKRQTAGSGAGKNADGANEMPDSRNEKRRRAMQQAKEEEQEELKKDAGQLANSETSEDANDLTEQTDATFTNQNGEEARQNPASGQSGQPLDAAQESGDKQNSNAQPGHRGSEKVDIYDTEQLKNLRCEHVKELEEQIKKLFDDYGANNAYDVINENTTDMDKAAAQVAANHKQFAEVEVSDVVLDHGNPEQYKVLQDYSAKIYEPLITQLKKIFADDREQKVYTQSGAVSMKRAVSGHLTTRVFEKKRFPADKADMCLMLLVDCSGSMRGDKANAAVITACTLAETMAFFHIPTYCMGFHMCEDSCVEQLHCIQWSNTQEERETLTAINVGSNNFDSYSIRYATELLRTRKEKHKLMNIISDGIPSAYFSEQEGIKQNALAITDARTEKIHVFGTAIGRQNDAVFESMYGKEFYLRVEDFNQLADQTAEMIKRIVKGW